MVGAFCFRLPERIYTLKTDQETDWVERTTSAKTSAKSTEYGVSAKTSAKSTESE